jgi:hypothetical protein
MGPARRRAMAEANLGRRIHVRFRQVGSLIAAIVCCVSIATKLADGANTYYVAPTGSSDSNNGSLGAPFATFTKAITTAAAGDTIFARGGTFNLSTTVSISGSKNGTAANPYHLLAYPGETPILDFRGQPYSASNSGLKGISLNGSYWHIKGLTIQYAADNGIAIGGSNNIVEQVVTRQNQDSGIQISGSNHPSNNLILNCDSYANFDFGGDGENADGFAVKFRELGPGNVISGVRAWENADDGFDFWQAENGVQVINSWSFHNGVADSFNNPPGYAGDSNGIKLGKDSGTHVLKNMLVWGNDGNGVDINGNATESGGTVTPAVIPHGVTAYNVTSALNGNRNFRYDENPTTTNPPSAHVIRNSISFSGTVTINPGNTVDHNTFAGPGGTPAGLGVAEADFVSIVDPVTTPGSYHPAGTGGDRSGVTMPVHGTGPAFAPRLPDGSLPPLDFLRLKAGSHLIDAGVNVGLPFNGSAPDLGWLETAPPAPALPGDYNGDSVVDTADFIVWRDNTNTSAILPNDITSGTVDESDYSVWREHFGQTLGAAATGISSAAAVPEPTGMLLTLIALSGGLPAQRAFRSRRRRG